MMPHVSLAVEANMRRVLGPHLEAMNSEVALAAMKPQTTHFFGSLSIAETLKSTRFDIFGIFDI